MINTINTGKINTFSSSPLENAIISLVLQQALLKLTSHTDYPTILAYCLKRTEQLLNLKFIILDHKHVQNNSNVTIEQMSKLITVADSALLNYTYFHCSLEQFKQICALERDNKIVSKLDLDSKLELSLEVVTPSDYLSEATNIINVINTLISKSWLIRQTNQEPATQDMVAYRLNFIQLQHDLQAIGYDLMIMKLDNALKDTDIATDITTKSDESNDEFQSPHNIVGDDAP